MSLSACAKCGGHVPLGPNASNRCEQCGEHVLGAEADVARASAIYNQKRAEKAEAEIERLRVELREANKFEGWAFAAVARAEKAEAGVERLRNENKEMSRMISAECADPNGTIWDHAKNLQAELARLRSIIDRHRLAFGNEQHMTGIPCPCKMCVANRDLYAECTDAAGRGEGDV